MVIKIIIATTILLSVGISYYTGSKKKNRRLDFNPTRSWQLVSDGALLIDVRTTKEYEEGHAEGALHIPRGMLEFWLDPESSYYKANKIKDLKKMVLFCALGLRSALATKSLVDMGFKNVAHVDGGFDALRKSGFQVVQKEKK